MKKIITYLIALLLCGIIPTGAFAYCPFRMTVYIHDSEHIYGRYWSWKALGHLQWGFIPTPNTPKMPLLSGYPAMPKVLSIEVVEGNPQNPHVKYTYDHESDFRCYWQSYATMNCHYFTIYEDEASCKKDDYGQSTRFKVIIGTKASPAINGVPDLREDRPGRNCILYLIAGRDQNLEQYAPANCTRNFQLDRDSLNSDKNTGNEETGERTYLFYPEFSTPKNSS